MSLFQFPQQPNRRSRDSLRACACFVLTCWFAAAAPAQWVVEYLQPSGASGSYCQDLANGQQTGTVGNHASVWSGSVNSWVDLHPVGFGSSQGAGAGGGQQVGNVLLFPGTTFQHAALWTGTAASWVDLHAREFLKASYAIGTDGIHQVGLVYLGPYEDSHQHAVMWSGTADSWVDLHPAAATESQANRVSGGHQIGSAIVGGAQHASLWNGTAASWVDLNPLGATSSNAWGIDGAFQAGAAIFAGVKRASLWSGTAASRIDLHPTAAAESSAADVYDGRQAGWARFGSIPRACVWAGTAASRVDLHVYLPSDFKYSIANGIWHDAVHTYVAGTGVRTSTGNEEALLWVGPLIPADIAPLGGDGQVNVDDLLKVINSWGPCGTPGNCPADIPAPGQGAGNGIVNVDDVLAVINAWGPVQ